MSDRKAIFFDRDGVVNYRICGEYISDFKDFKFTPDFIDFFKYIKECGYLALMVSNQQGVGKGLMTEQQLDEVHENMQRILKEKTGYTFDDIYYCTALADAGCIYRKPNPGMITKGMEYWELSPDSCWMIGDRKSDAKAGRRAGVKTILIGSHSTGKVTEADYICANLNIVKSLFSN